MVCESEKRGAAVRVRVRVRGRVRVEGAESRYSTSAKQRGASRGVQGLRSASKLQRGRAGRAANNKVGWQ